MTLITISHAAPIIVPPASLQLTCQSVANMSTTNDCDRFSLDSNLSGSSPHSSLASPLSPDFGSSCASSQPSICCPSSISNSVANSHQDQCHHLPTTPNYCHCRLGHNDNETTHHHHHHPLHSHLQHLQNQHHHQNANRHLQQQQQQHHHQLHHHPISLTTTTTTHGSNERLSLQQQPLPVRRLSRSEHRQSLSDLGYGKIESYTKLQRLGKGTYATVYLGRSRLSNDLVALKEILKEHDEGAPCTAIREVSLLRLLRHNNIVTLHDICHTPKKLTLVFEYVGPDLYAYMKENNHLLSMHNVRLLLYQILRGISFCHSRQVLHRDLKPQNLLINSRGELKICDFGLARAKSIPTKSYSNEVVTLWYRPPDVLLGNTDYNDSIDMWGVGCIFFEMASGRTLFPGSNVRQQLYLIFSCLGAPHKYNWPEILNNPDYQAYSFPPFRPEKLVHRVPRLDSDGMNLMLKFLRYRPQERISAERAKYEPFFSCLPDKIHHLSERESIFDLPEIFITLNPGQKLNHM